MPWAEASVMELREAFVRFGCRAAMPLTASACVSDVPATRPVNRIGTISSWGAEGFGCIPA
jgi:hypothetical protein